MYISPTPQNSSGGQLGPGGIVFVVIVGAILCAIFPVLIPFALIALLFGFVGLLSVLVQKFGFLKVLVGVIVVASIIAASISVYRGSHPGGGPVLASTAAPTTEPSEDPDPPDETSSPSPEPTESPSPSYAPTNQN